MVCSLFFLKYTCMHLLLCSMKGDCRKSVGSLSKMLWSIHVAGWISWKGTWSQNQVVRRNLCPQKADFMTFYCVEHWSLFPWRAKEAGADEEGAGGSSGAHEWGTQHCAGAWPRWGDFSEVTGWYPDPYGDIQCLSLHLLWWGPFR